MRIFLFKTILSILILYLADAILPNVYFQNYYDYIVMGIIFASVGYIIEQRFLHDGTLWTNTLIDFFIGILIVYVSSNILSGATGNLLGSIITAFFLGISEYYQHRRFIGAEVI